MAVDTPVLPPQIRAMHIVQTAVAGKLLSQLTEAGVPDALGDRSLQIGDLARETCLDEDALARALRAAVLLGVVERMADGSWRNTDLGQVLRRDVQGSIRDYVVYALHDGNWRAWQHMGDTLRTGRPSFAAANDGLEFWAYFDAHPDVGAAFHRAMAATAAAAAPLLPPAMHLERFERIADIGGGSGVVLAAVLRAAPQLTGVLYERADAIAAARRYFQEAGLSERVTLQVGDLLSGTLPAADAYILKNILHDHDERRCDAILELLHATMPDHARLFVIEAVLPDPPAPHPAIWRDLHMMVALGGRERTEADWRALLAAHGFAIDGIARLPGADAVIDARIV